MRAYGVFLRRAVAVGLVTLFSISAANASTKDGRFAVEDSGRVNCQVFLKARDAKSSSYPLYLGFIEGYLTAANRYEPNTFDLTPWHNTAALDLIFDEHCKKNPQDTLALAVQRLVVAMSPMRLAAYSDIIDVRDGKNDAKVYSSILKRAQFALSRRGLYQGAQDGKFSPETKTALQAFQKTAKLDPTGLPDVPTLWVLLNP